MSTLEAAARKPARPLSVAGLLLLLTALLAAAPAARAADCGGTQTGMIPLTELGAEGYKGLPGGLYPGGGNLPPAEHARAALARAAAILPRDPSGAPDPAGAVVLLSVGMSNTTQEFSTFLRQAAEDPQLHPSLSIVDGAQGGQTAADIRDPAANFWEVVDQRLAMAGNSAAQVQAIWLKSANRQPGADGNPDTLSAARQLAQDIQGVIEVARDRYPNLQLIFLSSRIYAGYASSTLNPEPYAYESGLALRWLIEAQIEGEPALDPAAGAPILLWGPYLWADGLRTRADGLSWACEDFQADGTHPSDSGRAKVAGLLMAYFKTAAASRGWFMVDPLATPIASPTPGSTATPRGSATPGTGRGTPTPGAPGLRSYRVAETPSGDRIWVAASDPQTQRRLDGIPAGRVIWICGPVGSQASATWGFAFDPDRLRALPEPAEGATPSTVRGIAADPAAATGIQCIRIDGVDEAVDGPPPGATALATREPVGTPIPAPGRLYLPQLYDRSGP